MQMQCDLRKIDNIGSCGGPDSSRYSNVVLRKDA
jgi:hypothetical protein